MGKYQTLTLYNILKTKKKVQNRWFKINTFFIFISSSHIFKVFIFSSVLNNYVKCNSINIKEVMI